MALGTGSIRFSQIVSEFGGVSPHKFSEYKALSGLGVSGIPASGAMRFSQFRGKSNQVTASVWVNSGYNTSSWVVRAHYGEKAAKWYKNDATGWNMYYDGRYGNSPTVHMYGAYRYINGVKVSNHYASYSSMTWGSWRWRRSSYFGRNRRGTTKYYRMYVDENVTTWVDTSSYQNQTTTAQIST